MPIAYVMPYVIAGLTLIGSTGLANAKPLTPIQCNSFPFVQTHRALTRDEVVNELAELVDVGYNPNTGDDYDYPADIQKSELRLNEKYQHDCRR